jgi:uncharacterized RDD family membrane protein YckC
MNEAIERLLRQEGFTLAPITKRAAAFFLDELLLTTLFMIVLWDVVSQAEDLQQMILITNAYVFEYMAIKILYQTVFVALYGASLGKMAVKVRVVSLIDGGIPSWPASFNRAVFRIISEMIFYLGFIWAMMDPANQAWHDRTAGTIVVDA